MEEARGGQANPGSGSSRTLTRPGAAEPLRRLARGSAREWLRWLCTGQWYQGDHTTGEAGKECLGDEAAVKLVQLLLGQHQAVSLS